MRIRVFDSVYPPSEDTFLLAEAVDFLRKGEKVLEMGCGTGYVAILAAKKGCHVTVVDINPKAVANALENAKANGVKIEGIVSDLFDNVDGIFDVILFNPPYLDDESGDPRYSEGDVIERFLERAPNYCKRAFLVTSNFSKTKPEQLKHFGAQLIKKRRLPFFEELYLWELRFDT